MASVFTHSAASGRRQPLLWLDTRLGMSDDLSTWQARVGNYVATQPDAAKRYQRPGADDARPNWLYSSLECNMTVPDVQLNGTSGYTVLSAFMINEPTASVGQYVCASTDSALYSYQGNLEFLVTETTGSGYGNNPIIPLNAGQYVVGGGDVQAGRYPSSRSFVNNVVSTQFNREAGRSGTFANTYFLIAQLVGRIRHFLVFDYVLNDQERAYWTTRLASTPP